MAERKLEAKPLPPLLGKEGEDSAAAKKRAGKRLPRLRKEYTGKNVPVQICLVSLFAGSLQLRGVLLHRFAQQRGDVLAGAPLHRVHEGLFLIGNPYGKDIVFRIFLVF